MYQNNKIYQIKLFSYTNKIDCRHEVAEILLKVAFNIITKPPNENGTTCTCILPILNIRKLSPFHNLTIILLGIK